jgi:hypothetical protein
VLGSRVSRKGLPEPEKMNSAELCRTFRDALGFGALRAPNTGAGPPTHRRNGASDAERHSMLEPPRRLNYFSAGC